MKTPLRLLVLLLLLGLISVPSAYAETPIRVALITGGHSFDAAAFMTLFESMEGIQVTHLPQEAGSEFFADISEWPYDVIVLYNLSRPDVPLDRRANFRALLKQGVGLVGLHHAIANYPDWPLYTDIIGARYFLEEKKENGQVFQRSQYTHDTDIKIHVADPAHPVTQGVQDFVIHDETYRMWRLHGASQLLLSTDHPESAAPIGWAKHYENARVVFLQPGHGPTVFKDPNYIRLVENAIHWTAEEAKELKAWEQLLPGDSLDAFQQPKGEWRICGEACMDKKDRKKLEGLPGAGVAINGDTGRTKHLVSKFEHGDVEAHIEFMVPQGSNSGVYFQGRYEIQVLDSWGKRAPEHSDCGGIYQRYHEDKDYQGERGYEGRPPRVNAARRPGEWQTYDVLFRAPRFDDAGKKIADAEFVKVVHNGVVVHEHEKLSGPTRSALYLDEKAKGPLMLQGDHGPVAYRNIRLRPLDGNGEERQTRHSGHESDQTQQEKEEHARIHGEKVIAEAIDVLLTLPSASPSEVLLQKIPYGEYQDTDWDGQPVAPGVSGFIDARHFTLIVGCDLKDNLFAAGSVNATATDIESFKSYLETTLRKLNTNSVCTRILAKKEEGVPSDFIIDWVKDKHHFSLFFGAMNNNKTNYEMREKRLLMLMRSDMGPIRHTPGMLQGMAPIENPTEDLAAWEIELDIKVAKSSR